MYAIMIILSLWWRFNVNMHQSKPLLNLYQNSSFFYCLRLWLYIGLQGMKFFFLFFVSLLEIYQSWIPKKPLSFSINFVLPLACYTLLFVRSDQCIPIVIYNQIPRGYKWQTCPLGHACKVNIQIPRSIKVSNFCDGSKGNVRNTHADKMMILSLGLGHWHEIETLKDTISLFFL